MSSVQKKNIWLIKDHSRKISENVSSDYLQWLSNEAHNCLSTINCHTKQVLWTMTIENIKYIKANMISMSVKSLPHRAYCFWDDLFFLLLFFLCFFFCNILVSMATNNKNSNGPKTYTDRSLLKNISVNVLPKYLQRLGSKCHFSIFPIVSLWEHSVAIATKHNRRFS